MLVPFSQGSNNELNTRLYLEKEEKRLFINSIVENWLLANAIAQNLEKIKKREMSGGIDDRDEIIKSVNMNEEGATAS